MANEEQAERIRIVNEMYKQSQKMDKDFAQSIKDYAKKVHKKRQESKNLEFKATGEIPKTEDDDAESIFSPVKLGIFKVKKIKEVNFNDSIEQEVDDDGNLIKLEDNLTARGSSRLSR